MSNEGESSQSSGPTEFHGLNWDYRAPVEMKRIQERDPKEWERLVIGRCNLIQWANWRIRGTGPGYSNFPGWKALEHTFKKFDITHRHLRHDPEVDEELGYSTAFLLAWQRKRFAEALERGTCSIDGEIRLYGHQFRAEDLTLEDPPGKIQRILVEAFGNWDRSCKAAGLKQAIANIPKPERIKRVVCIGLGLVDGGYEELDEHRLLNPSVSISGTCQHVAALAIVKQLQEITSQKVELYAADPDYGYAHKQALETLDQIDSVGIKFKICDPSFGKQEQFTKIDESSLVFTSDAFCPVHRIISEYTRPAVMICECLEEHDDPKPAVIHEPSPDVIWYEVYPEDVDDNDGFLGSHKIPGAPSLAHYSLRVANMLRWEYHIEKAFPHYKKGEAPQEFDLFPLEGQRPPYYYWNEEVRMYVRNRVD